MLCALLSELFWHPSMKGSQISLSYDRSEFLPKTSGKIQNIETTEQASLNQFCLKSKTLSNRTQNLDKESEKSENTPNIWTLFMDVTKWSEKKRAALKECTTLVLFSNVFTTSLEFISCIFKIVHICTPLPLVVTLCSL